MDFLVDYMSKNNYKMVSQYFNISIDAHWITQFVKCHIVTILTNVKFELSNISFEPTNYPFTPM